jgi:hypothetical protein
VGLVLLQGTLACLLTGREIHSRSAFAHEWAAFSMEPPFDCPKDNLSDSAFVWASKFIEGRDAIEEFVAYGVWPLVASVSFDQVSVDAIAVSKLKVPLPKFVAAHRDGEDEADFLARVELEAKVIVGSYTCPEHDACIAGLENNGRLYRVLELARLAYEPRSIPCSNAPTEVSKKRKMDATGKGLLKCPRAPRKKVAKTTKTSVPQEKPSLKRPSDMDLSMAKSAKLSKKTMPHAIAFVATVHSTLGVSSLKNVPSTSGPKAGGGISGSNVAESKLGSKVAGGNPGFKAAGGTSGSKSTGGTLSLKATVGAKKAAMPVKKCCVPMIGAMDGISSEESQESSPHGQAVRASAAKIESRPEPHRQFPMASVLRPNPEASLHIAAPLGAGEVSTGCLRLCAHLFVLPIDILTFVAAYAKVIF